MKPYPILLAAIILFAACKNASTQKEKIHTVVRKDDHSLSNADSVTPEHLSLDIRVDFDHKMISGSATWAVENHGAKEFILDDQDLFIDSVKADNKVTTFYVGNKVLNIGASLHIPVPADVKTVKIFYHTGDSATALQWLAPEQTGGKKFPFLFTQGEATHTRTWVPCPDGPGIRFTYDARVTVPKDLLALMSADNPQVPNDSGIFHFNMDIPVPAYMIALAVGDIRFATVDKRCGVYAEPDMIDRAVFELRYLGDMVAAAEKLYGPYRWGRYDVLVCPPSFPIGGMENPKLTFCTPTIIAGDRSLVNLIAHELAHNWSGNLVTSATWNDIWMNEGFTVYLERRITEELQGKSYADMLWELGYQDLEEEVKGFGDTSHETWLKQDLGGRDADDCLSDIPYEKGSLFLLLIERTVGRDKFDPFLKKYFDDHAFQSVTTEEFLDYMRKNLLHGDKTLEAQLDINAWVYGPGIPKNCPRADRDRFNAVDSASRSFLQGADPATLKTAQWTTHEWLYFLRGLPETLNVHQMQLLDTAFHLTASPNAEIANLWLTIALKHNYTAAYAAVDAFLSRVGRQKFLEPLYETMMKTGKEAMARDIFNKYRNNYHPLAQKNVEGILAGGK